MSIFSAILDFFGGKVIGEVKDGLLRAQQQYLTAETDRAKLDAEQNMKYWQGRMDLAIAASNNDKWWSPRSVMGLSVALYIAKIIVWDTVLGWGVTQYPGTQVTFIVMTVVGFYFASKSAENIASILSNRIAR